LLDVAILLPLTYDLFRGLGKLVCVVGADLRIPVASPECAFPQRDVVRGTE
jgi:hypothetical protein